MIELLISALGGLIQGLSEFLPISSSGHLVLFHDFFNLDFPDSVAFDVVLHLGTLLALLIYFYPEVKKYLFAFGQSFRHWDLANNKNQLLAWYILIGTFPAAIIGYFFEDIITIYFRNSVLVAAMLIIFGIVLFLADSFFAKTRKMEELNWPGSFLIGCAQALALVPGVSRSGITIIAGLSQKLNREQAAKYAFLLSIPIVFGAGLKKVLDLSTESLNSSEFLILAVGFFTSVVSGYLVIKYFLRFLNNHSLKIFSYYRIALGLVILTITLFNF